MTHEFYMQRCINLAKKALGKTYPNPLVGAVIVHKDEIIGEGFHQKAGEPHAEINAINSVKNTKLLPQSTIYVSLEPCAHFGKTPPCALKLKEIGFKKVIVGAMDVHDKVNGKGKKILEEAGIPVETNVLQKESEYLNRRFFTFHQKKRPFIILKWAESGDGFLDDHFKPVQITNSLAKQFVHQLRSEEHAILVGTNTAVTDNPSLTCREVTGRNPIRILIDFDLNVPENYQIFNGDAETFVFNTVKDELTNNLKFIKINRENFIENLLAKLFELEIQSVIIEGGKFTLQQFIDQNLWDEALIFKNEHLLLKSGTKAPIFKEKEIKIKNLRENKVYFYQNSK